MSKNLNTVSPRERIFLHACFTGAQGGPGVMKTKIAKNLVTLPRKEIGSRDFGGLQMILFDRAWVPDVLIKVYYF